jgi:predicted nucleic acid-binding protein
MSVDFLFDTSTVIELEQGARLDVPGDATWGIAAMTLAELNLGVLRASDSTTWQRRLRTYTEVARTVVLPFDAVVARTYAELAAWAEAAGGRPAVADAIIAATAATHGATLVTLDAGFARLAGFEGLDVLVLEA